MYKPPEQFKVPAEVKELDKDRDELGMMYDLENWYITHEWSEKFKGHLNKLLKLAEAGEPWSQYNVGIIYLLGYLYSSKEEYDKNFEKDALEGSKWLVKAAKQGFIVAVDNLVSIGVGPEADRLRTISREIGNQHPEYMPIDRDLNVPVVLPPHFEAVWKVAYGKNS